MGSIPGIFPGGIFPGVGNGNPLQYSCLDNPTNRGAWRATVRGVAQSRTQLKQFTSQRSETKRYAGSGDQVPIMKYLGNEGNILPHPLSFYKPPIKIHFIRV